MKNNGPLANQTFENITKMSQLSDIHEHLYKKYVTLGQVIEAWKVHHKHFYSL